MPPSSDAQDARQDSGGHPATDRLEDFSHGRLNDAESAEIELHLENCIACCDKLSGLSARGDRFVRELVSAVRTAENRVDDAALPSASCCTPKRVGRFEVRQEIGQGGFGIVLEAWDTTLRREVALKIPRMAAFLSAEMQERFLREAQAAAALDHRSIVPIYEAGQDGEICFIAAAYCRGPNLEEWLKERNDPVPVRTAAWLVSGLAEAVQHAHSRGVLHRDLKPSNVLLEPVEHPATHGDLSSHNGSSLRMPAPDIDFPYAPKLTDFGLAKLLGDGPDSTHSNVVMGTAAYMSPEQASGRGKSVGPTTDVFSLGAMLYQLLTGHPPLVGETELETILRVQNDDPIPPTRIRPRLPKDLETICLKCLEKEPERRYITAEELADDLQRFLRGDAILARRTRWPGLAWRWCRRNPLPAGLCALSGLLLLALVAGSTIATVRLNEQHEATLKQLGETRAAEARAVDQGLESRRQLFNSLIAESRARRRSGRMGQRFENMESLEQAAVLARELNLSSDDLHALRTEVIATTALTDLRVDREWTAYASSTSISGIAFDAQVEQYAMLDPEGRILLRRLADNALLSRIDTDPPQSRNSDWRLNLRISPDGRYIAGGHTETPPHQYGLPTRVWDLTTSALLITVPGPSPRSGSFDFSPDSRLFAAGCSDGSIAVFDLETRSLRQTLQAGGFPYALQFNPDGNRIAVCHANQLSIISLDPEVDRRTFQHDGPVLSVSWNESGKRIATGTGGDDDRAYIRDVADGPLITCTGHASDVLHVDFSPDGQQLVSTSWQDSRIWDALTGRELLVAPGNVGSFSSDGRWLELGYAGTTVGRWEVAAPEGFRLLRERPDPDAPDLDVSPDGRLLMATDQNRLLFWDLECGALLESVTLPHAGEYLRARFDPAGRRLVTTSRGGIHVWPFENVSNNFTAVRIGPPRPVATTFESEPNGLAMSLDGRALVADGYRVSVLDLDTQGLPVPWFRDSGWGMAGSRDGRWLATSTWHGYQTHVWDLLSGRCVASMDGRSARVAFSPDRSWLWISTTEGYAVHEVGSWRQRHVIASPEIKNVWPIAFCETARLTAVAPDGVPRLLDSETLENLATFLPPTGERVTSMVFDLQGDHLAAKTVTGAIHVWDLRSIRRRIRELGVDWAPADRPPQSADVRPPVELTVDTGEFTETEDITALVEGDVSERDAHYRRGLTRMRFRRWGDALSDFKRVIALDSHHPDALFQSGVAQFHLGNNVEAVNEFTRVIALAPDHAAAYRHRGHVRTRLHDWQRASDDFTHVIEHLPQDWRSWFDRGEMRLQLACWSEAVSDMTQAIRLEPGHHNLSRILTCRGLALYRLGRFADALLDGEMAVEADPGSWYYLNNLAWALATCPDQQLRDADRAVELALESIGLYRQNGTAWNTLGVAYFRQEEWRKSHEAFEESMNLRSGGDSFDWFFLAMLEWNDGNPEAAREWMERANDWMETNAADDPQLEMFRDEARQLIHAQ